MLTVFQLTTVTDPEDFYLKVVGTLILLHSNTMNMQMKKPSALFSGYSGSSVIVKKNEKTIASSRMS
jgi:hypothetical protein